MADSAALLVDSTVKTSALVDHLFDRLPENGSELVIFDINHAGELDEFVKPEHDKLLQHIKTGGNGSYTISVITNRNPETSAVMELRQTAATPGFINRALDLQWPENVYSLSHVALPFPLNDEVYGLQPADSGQNYPHLGDIQLVGESGTLILPPALLQRLRSNPFYDYIEERLLDVIGRADANSNP